MNNTFEHGPENLFFSIIIPVYNCEKYLGECLDSCLNQDLPKEEYEIICVDDGSTDKSPAILDDYASRCENLIVIHKKNEGSSVARSTGLDRARGEYIWFVDADDLIADAVLSSLKRAAQNQKCSSFLFQKYDFVEEMTEEEKVANKNKSLRPVQKVAAGFITNKLYQRKAIVEGKVDFVPGVQVGQDELFHFEFSKRYGDPTPLEILAYLYRINDSSVTHNKNENATTKKRTRAIEKQILYLLEEQKTETGAMREKTIGFLFSRRQFYFEYCVTRLSFRDYIAGLTRAKRAGIFSINSLAKEIGIDKKKMRVICPIFKYRWKYLWREKICVNFERILHPVRTVKNLMRKRKKK